MEPRSIEVKNRVGDEWMSEHCFTDSARRFIGDAFCRGMDRGLHGALPPLLLLWTMFSVLLNHNPIAAAERYDLILKNGRIVDGAATPWYIADLAVRDGKIAAIGRLNDAEAARSIDASGLVVAPGFIDMMGQTGSPFLKDPAAALNLLTQGVTTINAGEGDSTAPLTADT